MSKVAGRGVPADPVLAAAAIIGGMRSCVGVALAEDSWMGPQQVVDAVQAIPAALIGSADEPLGAF